MAGPYYFRYFGHDFPGHFLHMFFLADSYHILL